jgi:hypothetical protein
VLVKPLRVLTVDVSSEDEAEEHTRHSSASLCSLGSDNSGNCSQLSVEDQMAITQTTENWIDQPQRTGGRPPPPLILLDGDSPIPKTQDSKLARAGASDLVESDEGELDSDSADEDEDENIGISSSQEFTPRKLCTIPPLGLHKLSSISAAENLSNGSDKAVLSHRARTGASSNSVTHAGMQSTRSAFSSTPRSLSDQNSNRHMMAIDLSARSMGSSGYWSGISDGTAP